MTKMGGVDVEQDETESDERWKWRRSWHELTGCVTEEMWRREVTVQEDVFVFASHIYALNNISIPILLFFSEIQFSLGILSILPIKGAH